ncbi:molybdopterin-binding protein, partial [Ameyamaea chiangmaiensis]
MEPCFETAPSYEDALARLMQRAADRPQPSEPVPPTKAAGRILAAPLTASAPRPPVALSAMDGFALCGASSEQPMNVAGTTHAGQACAILPPGAAWRVLTGAPVPRGADRVVPQEYTRASGAHAITLTHVPELGAHIRHRAEEYDGGAPLIPAGTHLDWRHIALCVAQGAPTLPVLRQPRIAIVSSGAELSSMPDSNAPMLDALLRHAGARVLPPVTLAGDDRADLARHIAALVPQADIVVTTGGVSASETD